MKSEFSIKRRSVLKNSIVSGAYLSFLSKTPAANPRKIASTNTVILPINAVNVRDIIKFPLV